MSDDDIDNSNLEQPEESEAAHFVWQYFAVANNTDARKAGAKNAVCMFSSVNAVCSSTYLRTSSGPVLAREKLEYVHVLLSTKKTMTDVVHSELPRKLSLKTIS